LFLERTSRATLAPVVLKSAVKPVDPALFLSGHRIDVHNRCIIGSAATCPDGTPVPFFSGHVINAPTLKT
jgi:hypothetical protein